MTLEESIDGLTKTESNSVTAYLEPRLISFIEQNGKVTIDYRDNSYGGGGYSITVGEENQFGSC